MPVWAKLAAIAVCLFPPAWWLADRHDRVANQDRLAAIASDVAGRPVTVRCPGPLRRIGPDTRAGSVSIDADGRSAGWTRLSTETCETLDALAEGRLAAELACAARSSSCGDDVLKVAWAVNTLTHEAFHMRGYHDEGVTECYSMQTMASTAQRLGATPEQARNLSVLFVQASPELKPVRYQAPGCADEGPLDLRPDDPLWP
jgi:hypothetical protein